MMEHEPAIPIPQEDTPAPTVMEESALHQQLRTNCIRYLLLAAVVGIAYALFFCRIHGSGINVFLFSLVWVLCQQLAFRQLGMANLRRDAVPIAGILLLSASVFWTANVFVREVSSLGTMAMMLVLLLGAFADCWNWSFRQFFRGSFSLIFSSIGKLPEPFIHLYRRSKGDSRRGRSVLIGLLIAVPLCILAVSILAAGDMVFGYYVDSLFHPIRDLPAFWGIFLRVIACFLTGFLAFYCTLISQCAKAAQPLKRSPRQADSLIAMIFTGALSLVYLLFCFIQLAYLFPGQGSPLPNGYTYAEYAREGFFHLLFVSGCNLLLVLLCADRFVMSKGLKGILSIVCGCTYIMIASSALRMSLYIQAYGLTFLRILVLWFLLVLAILMGCVTTYVFRKNLPLGKLFLGICLVMWLLFAFARVDRIAARYNFERFGPCSDSAASNAIYDLSMDAVPVMVEYDYHGMYSSEWEGYLTHSVPREYEEHGVRTFNFALWEAYRATEVYHDP